MIGNLVFIKSKSFYPIKGYSLFPGKNGFVKSVPVGDFSIGIITESKEHFCKILFSDGKQLWLDDFQVEVIK